MRTGYSTLQPYRKASISHLLLSYHTSPFSHLPISPPHILSGLYSSTYRNEARSPRRALSKNQKNNQHTFTMTNENKQTPSLAPTALEMIEQGNLTAGSSGLTSGPIHDKNDPLMVSYIIQR